MHVANDILCTAWDICIINCALHQQIAMTGSIFIYNYYYTQNTK